LGALGAFDALSLDGPAYGSHDPEAPARSETIGAVDGELERAEDRAVLDAALKQIPTRDRRVLHMRFIEDRTQSDIAERIGVSQMQVSRILRRALVRLRGAMEGSPPPAERHFKRARRASAFAGA
jgi:RNA polymerase sigma-B factor